MFGSIGQNWRQIMQMPQQYLPPTGNMFPIQNASGGWMMPGGPAPFMPMPLRNRPASPAQTSNAPLSFAGNSNNGAQGAYGMGLGGLSDASRGWTPGMDANGWSGMFGLGMGANDGSSGLGGLLGLGGYGGMVGYDAGSAGGPGAVGAIGGGGGDLGPGWW